MSTVYKGRRTVRSFVVVVDAQQDFMLSEGALSVPGAAALIAPLRAWLADLRTEDTAGVLFTFDTHDWRNYAASREPDAFPPHCVKGTPGWQLVVDLAEIHHAIPIYRMEKGLPDMWGDSCGPVEAPGDFGHSISRFGRTFSRERFFAELHDSGPRDVTVVGVAADYCVRLAVAGLVARGFRVTVRAGLTRGVTREISAVHRDEWTGAQVALV